jgi:hypothetical protein
MPTKTKARPQANAAPAAIPVTPPAGIKKVNLAGFGKKTPSGKTYPVLPDPDGEIGKLVAAIRGHVEDLDALTAALDLEKAELRSLASPFFFASHHGKGEVASSVACRNGEQEILVAFQNRYKLASDDAQIIEVIGADRAALYFQQGFNLKVEGAKIPADQVEELLGELQALFAKHCASEALTATSGIVPKKNFHTERHTALTLEENAAIEKICPIVVQVKTKGRGEDK